MLISQSASMWSDFNNYKGSIFYNHKMLPFFMFAPMVKAQASNPVGFYP